MSVFTPLTYGLTYRELDKGEEAHTDETQNLYPGLILVLPQDWAASLWSRGGRA